MISKHRLIDVIASGLPLCCLDRVSLVAQIFDRVSLERWLSTEVAVEPAGIAPYPYRQSFITNFGMHIAFKDASADVPAIRIEFNPAKIHTPPGQGGIARLLYPLFACLRDVRFTRIDVAVDYGQDVSGYDFSLKDVTVKSIVYRGRSGAIETIYLGGASSARRFRIYNKALESKMDGHILWRVEAQYRLTEDDAAGLWAKDLFSDLQIRMPIVDETLKITERSIVYYLLHHPEAMSELAPSSRSKYRRLMALDTVDIIHPEVAWSNQCGPYLQFLNWLQSPSNGLFENILEKDGF
jgi:hypothetical protein